MVKADAYGLGAVPCARALARVSPWGFGVATLEEASQLRAAGIEHPLVVFTPASLADLPWVHDLDVRAVLDRPDVVAGWDRPFHLEIDTGMARCGVRWDDPALPSCASPRLEGVFTHLHSADTYPDSTEVQWDRFLQALGLLGTRPPLVHVANSAGAWRLRDALDLLRPGIYVYGGRHAPDLPPPLPVLALRAPVVSVRTLGAGDTVSYGATWTTPRATTIATIGVGYADGVPRAIAGRAQVLIGGRRYPIVGRVTMDFIMADVGPDAGVRPGDAATLIGPDGSEAITIDEFAGWAGTISYEILARLGTRVQRRYDAGGAAAARPAAP
jgi:alanine racemase